ncbi:hypothetical protein QE453_001090 [Agrobacterium sp. SORGH_AS440]|nr:hypothetical protein [Agrobacterium sp. SORGH_AS_0440]
MDQMALRTDENPAALSDTETNSAVEEAKIIYNLPFNDLLFRAQQVHRRHFDANAIQMSRLLSINNGRLPRRLQLLQSVRPKSDRSEGFQTHGSRAGAGGGAQGKRRWGDALLHGRGLA